MPDPRRSPQYEDAARLLGRMVTALRTLHGLTQEALADRTGLSRNQVQNIEHSRGNQRDAAGRPKPGNARLETVFALAHVLEVRVTDLIDPGVTEHELLRIAADSGA